MMKLLVASALILHLYCKATIHCAPNEEPGSTKAEGYRSELRYGSKGDKITINGSLATDVLFKIVDKRYGCLRLRATYLDALRHEKFAASEERTAEQNEMRLRLISEFERKSMECAPYYSDLIEQTLSKMAHPVAWTLQIWMSAMDRYLQATGVEGLANLFVERNLRLNEKLVAILRELLNEPDKIDEDHFGDMLLSEDSNELRVIDRYLMRAFHAGDGFCGHLRSSPFSHLTHQITQTLYTYGHLKQKDTKSRTRSDIMEFIKDLSLLRRGQDGKSHEPIILLFASELTCLSFKFFPTDELVRFIGHSNSRLSDTIQLSSSKKNWSDKEFIDTEINKLVTSFHGDTKQLHTCKWIQFFQLSRLSSYLFEMGQPFYKFLVGPFQLASSQLLERCTIPLLRRLHEEDKLELWPEYPENLIAGNLVRRLERLPLGEITRKARMLELIDTRTFRSIGEFDQVWLDYQGEYLESEHKASKMLVDSYATGDGFCKFYTELFEREAQFKVSNLFALIELFFPVLDMRVQTKRAMKLGLSNDASAFFVLWRLCWLNSLLPIELKDMNLNAILDDTDSRESIQNKEVKLPKLQGSWRFRPLREP